MGLFLIILLPDSHLAVELTEAFQARIGTIHFPILFR